MTFQDVLGQGVCKQETVLHQEGIVSRDGLLCDRSALIIIIIFCMPEKLLISNWKCVGWLHAFVMSLGSCLLRQIQAKAVM